MTIGEFAVGAVVVGVLFILWISSAATQVRRANEKVKAEVVAAGKVYNPDAAGKPLRDGCGLIVLTIVFVIGAVTLLGAIVPLP